LEHHLFFHSYYYAPIKVLEDSKDLHQRLVNSLPPQTWLEDLTSNFTNFSSLTTFIIRGYPFFAINDVSSVVSTLSLPNGFFWLPDDIHGTVKGLQVRDIERQKMHMDQSIQLFDSLPFLLGTHDPKSA
jgi:hypothetical protein